mmetsp:Transcript_16150/g.44663  ORF Transcript_16150/g.44663 Transcript_16150/m.44663 type:complete len:444 (-) Transcript_16150:151-1482(-)
MQQNEGGAVGGHGHPLPLPSPHRVALGAHLSLVGERHVAREDPTNVLRVQVVRHDVRDRGALRAAEGQVDVADRRRDAMAVQVEAVVLDGERCLNLGGQVVVGLPEASGTDDEVGVDALAGLRHHASLDHAGHSALLSLELACPPRPDEARVQDVPVAVEVGHHIELRIVTAELPALAREQQLHDAEGDPHDREEDPHQAAVDAGCAGGPRALVPSDQRLAQTREEDVLEGDDAGDPPRGAPMRLSEQHGWGLLGDLGGREGHVDGGFGRPDDEDALSGGRRLVDVLGRVQDLPLEIALSLGPLRHVGHLAIHARRNHRKIKVLVTMLSQLEGVAFLSVGARHQSLYWCVEPDVQQQVEVLGVALDVSLGLGSRRILAPFDSLHGEVRELEELLRNLDAIGVVVLSPQAANFRSLVKHRDLVSMGQQGPRHLQTSNTSADNTD